MATVKSLKYAYINNREGWHKDVNEKSVIDAVQRQMSSLDNPGFCLACGAENDGCEPDACNYKCEDCSEMQVFGAETLLQYL